MAQKKELPRGFPDFGTEKRAWLLCSSFRMDPDGNHGRTRWAGLGGRLFGFRNRKFAASPVEPEAYTIFSAKEVEMSPSDPTQPEAAGSGVARAKRQYQPPAFKKLGLADVLKSLESSPPSNDPAVREKIEELRLLLEQRGLDESNV